MPSSTTELPDLSRVASVTEVGEVMRSAARRLLNADGATFVLRDGDQCFYADEDAIAPLWKGQRFPISECVSGWAMVHRAPAVIADIETDDRVPLQVYRPTFVRSLVMVPMGGPPVGAVGCYWTRTGASLHADLDLLTRLADRAAAAITRLGMATAPWAPTFRT